MYVNVDLMYLDLHGAFGLKDVELGIRTLKLTNIYKPIFTLILEYVLPSSASLWMEEREAPWSNCGSPFFAAHTAQIDGEAMDRCGIVRHWMVLPQ